MQIKRNKYNFLIILLGKKSFVIYFLIDQLKQKIK